MRARPTAAKVAAYHPHLAAGGRSTATIANGRSALNSLPRYLVDHDLLPARQAREALGVRLPRARQHDARGAHGAQPGPVLAAGAEAKARIADDPLAGSRDAAIVRVLGDAGLRGEELAALERRASSRRAGAARLRALDVRHSKVTASGACA